MRLANDTRPTQKDTNNKQPKNPRRETEPLRRTQPLQKRRIAQRIDILTRTHRITLPRRLHGNLNRRPDRQPDRTRDLRDSIDQRPSQGLVLARQTVRGEEHEAGVEGVCAEDGEAHGGEAVGPVGCCGADGDGEEEDRDADAEDGPG